MFAISNVSIILQVKESDTPGGVHRLIPQPLVVSRGNILAENQEAEPPKGSISCKQVAMGKCSICTMFECQLKKGAVPVTFTFGKRKRGSKG